MKLMSNLNVLEYFLRRQFHFVSNNMLLIQDKMSAEDKSIFNIETRTLEVNKIAKSLVFGARLYCMKEPLDNLEKARFNLKM